MVSFAGCGSLSGSAHAYEVHREGSGPNMTCEPGVDATDRFTEIGVRIKALPDPREYQSIQEFVDFGYEALNAALELCKGCVCLVPNQA